MKTESLTYEGCKKEFIRCLTALTATRDKAQVFCDFVELAAISISNRCDMIQYEEREKRYLQLVSEYPKEKVGLFGELLSFIVQAYSLSMDAPRDFLGELFHKLELHDRWKGQFFTTMDICKLLSEMQINDLEEKLHENEYVTFHDPCVGSGALVLGFASAVSRHHYDYTTKILATGIDIDLKCVHMAYIQTSLYGIPAVIVHGDSLLLKEWSYWFTPAFCKAINSPLERPSKQTAKANTPDCSAVSWKFVTERIGKPKTIPRISTVRWNHRFCLITLENWRKS